MRPRTLAGVAAAAVAGVAASPALAAEPHHASTGPRVAMEFAAFDPERIDAVAGDTVTWHNDSVARHTVTADDGSFDSGALFGGDSYARRFGAPAVVRYHCSVHPSMRGEVDVRRVLLDAPREPAAPGRPFTLTGRAALPAGGIVSIERDAGADGFVPVAKATVGGDRAFATSLRPRRTARYRAVAAGEPSPAVRLLVLDRRVSAAVRRGGGGRFVVRVRVTPRSPHATVVLKLRLRERFGWWPARRATLDHRSRARFVVRPGRRVRARVVLTLRDGATVLARSRVLRIGPS